MPSTEYEEYEQACAEIKQENAKLLSGFKQWLLGKGLTKKTIQRHQENIEFYINTFLLYQDAVPAKDGAAEVSNYLGYWFIRKAMWASSTTMKQNASSLKKFFTFMYEQSHIDADDLKDLKETIMQKMPKWIRTLERYDNPDITDPAEIWEF